MSMAVAPPTAAPFPMVDREPSPKTYPILAPLSSGPPLSSTPSRLGPVSNDLSAEKTTPPEGKRLSPNTSRSGGGSSSKISIKKEPPTSPSLQTGRHRPRKLDLSATTPVGQGALISRGPLTAREGLAMQDVGLACLSPGFQTQDPTMREQLQRSISVRDQQRSIIESRLQKTAKGDGPDGTKPSESNLFGSLKTPSSKKRPPPGLSIVPPSASQFANERVIQSAPLNQTFTGRPHPHPMTRHLVTQPSDFSSSPHIHHTPANQTNNRLPPIADVFGSDALVPRDRDGNHRNGFYQSTQGSNPSQSNNLGPLPSPGLPANPNVNPPPHSAKRPREYRSAEEAVHELAGGREELYPRIVHYGGHQPVSPPSPLGNNSGTGAGAGVNGVRRNSPGLPGSNHLAQQTSLPHLSTTTSRRRSRNEYERDNGSPPLGNGPDLRFRTAPGAPGMPPAAASGPGQTSFGLPVSGRDSPDTQRRKKEEFLALCARAWDLFHS